MNKVELIHLTSHDDVIWPRFKVYKSTGDVEAAREMFDRYSAVTNDNPDMPWLKWRAIVISRRRPGKMFVQANTVLKGTSLGRFRSGYRNLISILL